MSAVDPENEHPIAESIRTLGQCSMAIVIAHKLSTVPSADTIVVLSEDGTVQDRGTHAELIARRPVRGVLGLAGRGNRTDDGQQLRLTVFTRGSAQFGFAGVDADLAHRTLRVVG